MVVSSTGNVGIGTTSPISRLEIDNGYSTFKWNNDDWRIRFTRSDESWNAGIKHNGFGDTSFWTGNLERLRIDSAGRLLVGTSSAFDELHPFEVVGSGVQYGRFSNSAAGTNIILSKARGSRESPLVVADGDTLGEIAFKGYSSAASAYRNAAYITAQVDGEPDTGGDTSDTPGRLIFSTTANGASSPTERMRISHNGNCYVYSNQDSFLIRNNNGAGTTRQFISGRYSATGTTSGGTLSFQVWTNGNVENTNNSYTGISDIKLKENIVDASSQWDDIKALRPVNYNFKEGQTHTQLGLIAQEVELVSPGLVSESPDRDEEGNDLGTVTKSVNYSVLYMKAVKALQEAMERIEALEARLTDAGF